MRINIAGVQIDNVTKLETLQKISEYLQDGKPHFIATTYSEFIVFAQRDERFKSAINNSDLSLPDGIGILWAAKYLSLPSKSTAESFWQVIYSGASLIFDPSYCRTIITETVTGSRLIWDIAEFAAINNYSMSLVGGQNNVTEMTAVKLKEKNPSLKIKLALSNNIPFDDDLVARIAASDSDILLIAYQPPKQEKWLAENLYKLNVKLAMGLGGTFDYVSGVRAYSPKVVNDLGLEWLWRLVTQPWRIKRIYNAIIVFISIVYKYKINKEIA